MCVQRSGSRYSLCTTAAARSPAVGHCRCWPGSLFDSGRSCTNGVNWDSTGEHLYHCSGHTSQAHAGGENSTLADLSFQIVILDTAHQQAAWPCGKWCAQEGGMYKFANTPPAVEAVLSAMSRRDCCFLLLFVPVQIGQAQHLVGRLVRGWTAVATGLCGWY